jgi:hypothetical protein
LDGYFTRARTVVEVEQDNLLPGAETELTVFKRNG